MTSEHLSKELEEVILARLPLREIASTLRDYRHQGVTRQEVQHALEVLRDEVVDEAVEDQILEVMDLVSGFCSRENTVWDD